MEINTENDFHHALESAEKEYIELFEVFAQELVVFQEKIRESGDQTWRRAYTRTLFSMIEALTCTT